MARKIAIVVVLAVAVIVVVARKRVGRPSSEGIVTSSRPTSDRATSRPATAIPRLVDLGMGKCIPCKKMMPILAEIAKEYAGRLEVDVIDIAENPDASRQYKVKLIPTQIFFDASGKERFRHEGFMPKADILAKWKELGIDLGAPKAAPRAEPKAGPNPG